MEASNKKIRDAAGNDLIVACTALAMMVDKAAGVSRPLRDVRALSFDIYGLVNKWIAQEKNINSISPE